jgi:hypothetical protein
MQSYLTGARDRAIHSQAPRGVRFLFDPKYLPSPPNPPGTIDASDLRNRTARSMVYIGPISPDLGTLDLAADGRTLTNTAAGLWDSLAARGVLVAGTRIRVPSGPGPASDGLWYQVDDASFLPTGALATPNTLLLATTHLDLTGTATPGLNYELELAPAVLPNQEVAVFAPGIVIDLANSQLPAGWAARPQRMDLLFAPSGAATGPVAAAGKVHLVLRDVRDMELGLVPGDLNRKGDELVVTVFPRTGHVATSPLYVAAPGDPFRYAETGEAAK